MALTLADIINAPTDPDDLKDHLRANGVIPTPQPAQPIPEMAPPGVPTRAPSSVRDMKLMLGANASPEPAPVKPMAPLTMEAAPKFMQPSPDPALAKPAAIPNFEPPTATPSSLVSPMTPPVMPTKEESVAAGKQEYAANRPQVTADPGSAEYFKQELARDAYDRAHPLGSDVSARPGFLGKLEHIAGRVGDIAGTALIPRLMAEIPGTMLNKDIARAEERQQLAEAQTRESQEKARESAEKTAEVTRQNLQSEIAKREQGSPESFERDQAGNIVGWKDKTGAIRSMEDPNTPEGIKTAAEEAKLAPKFETDKVTGNIVKLSTDKDGKTTSEVVYKGTPNQKFETKSVIGPDGHSHEQIFDVTPGSATFGNMVKDLGRSKEDKQESPTAAITKEKAGERLVIGFDKSGQAHLVPHAQAEEMGLTHIAQANEGDRKEAENNTSALNELGVKTRNLTGDLKALDQGPAQRAIIAFNLAHSSNSTADQLARAASLSAASEDTKNFVTDVVNLREAALGLPKIMTGGSRVSEVQAEALWKTIADGAAGDSKYALNQLKKFDQMIDRQWRKVPQVEGNPRERAFPEETGGGGGTVKMGGQEMKLDADGTFTHDGHKYRPIPGTKKAELVE